MARFRRRKVEIEAVRFDGQNFEAVREFCPPAVRSGVMLAISDGGHGVALAGDWVVRDGGRFLVLKPDVFAATYEPAEEV